MEWCEIVLSVADPLLESVTNRLFELGAEGVSETGEGSSRRLHGYFRSELTATVLSDLETFVKSLADLFPSLPLVSFETNVVVQENWAERYKEFYAAQKLSERFFLKPLWDEETTVPTGMEAILMEPGQAFGTGLHPSTKLCIRFLESSLSLCSSLPVEVLDVGTGSGILAIVARKLGAAHVLGIDNDPIAVETAKENVRANHCEQVEISGQDLYQVRGTFPVVVSNILLETHRELASQYQRLVGLGGQLILSGLLGSQKQELLQIISAFGFVLESSESMQEWAAYRFIRRDAI